MWSGTITQPHQLLKVSDAGKHVCEKLVVAVEEHIEQRHSLLILDVAVEYRVGGGLYSVVNHMPTPSKGLPAECLVEVGKGDGERGCPILRVICSACNNNGSVSESRPHPKTLPRALPRAMPQANRGSAKRQTQITTPPPPTVCVAELVQGGAEVVWQGLAIEVEPWEVVCKRQQQQGGLVSKHGGVVLLRLGLGCKHGLSKWQRRKAIDPGQRLAEVVWGSNFVRASACGCHSPCSSPTCPTVQLAHLDRRGEHAPDVRDQPGLGLWARDGGGGRRENVVPQQRAGNACR